ncbi:MAG TPA: HD domain-containing protein [Flavipsychrobacter sp.]|nr:HD domain-containing protein [Flavipsychrobacter sp.]
MDTLLKQVKEFADRAHGEQQRRYTKERYIVHPVRIMELCSEYTEDKSILSAALLHDVLEDTPVTKEELQQFLNGLMNEHKANKTVRLVVELTDVYTKTNYPQWNRDTRKAKEASRIEKTSGASQTIKYADIIDNCLEMATHSEDEFALKFLKECRSVLKHIPKGDKQLYRRAVITVESCLQQLQQQNRKQKRQTTKQKKQD